MKNTKTAKGNIYATYADAAKGMIRIVLDFFSILMPVTLARRRSSIILIASGAPVPNIVELTGLTDRSVKSLGRAMRDGDTGSLLKLKEGRGRKRKTADVEEQILAELEKGNYHTRQQIADMIWEKFYISISVSAVGKLLKKRDTEAEMRLPPC